MGTCITPLISLSFTELTCLLKSLTLRSALHFLGYLIRGYQTTKIFELL